MNKKHLWIILKFELPLAVYVCHHCQGIKVRDHNGKFHYFYKSTTSHC